MKDKKDMLIVPKEVSSRKSVVERAREFLKVFDPFEPEHGGKLVLLHDIRSDAVYVNCHLDSDVLVKKTDLDAVLDPQESEDYKLNRGIYTDTHAYRLMEADALKGRSFEDLVVEYDTSYRIERPLKVFGGQHRIMAIRVAVKNKVSVAHGIRVYFCLSTDQKFNIAMANNTSIAVSNDLLDRMQEELLGSDMRDWCQTVGLLDKGQNFADRRSPQGVPTVRVARTLLVNFYLGKELKNTDFRGPKVCSSGPGIDEDYTVLRGKLDWSDKALIRTGQEFRRLHRLQRERVLSRSEDAHQEFANKAIHPCVTASWAYAAGRLQRTPKSLENHFALTEAPSPEDPLNAKALLNARLKGVDPDTYRGLGARINNTELGRMVEVFLLQAQRAKRRGITRKLANAAIKSYEAERAKRVAQAALKGI